MDGHAEFHDWEILLVPEAGEDLKPLEASEVDSEDGAIKTDYFALDSLNQYQKGAAVDGQAPEEQGQVDSDNPSWVDPESDSLFLDRPKREMSFPVTGFPRKDLGGFWSDESSEGQRSHFGSEKGELGETGDLETGERADRDEEDGREVGLEKMGEIEGREMGHEKPVEEGPGEHMKTDESYNSSVEMGDKSVGSENVLAGAGEKRRLVWWKFPFEVLKFCAFRVKPVWSISIAAAILGVLMLGKRLYKMKQKTRSIPLNIILDEKKASQLKIQAARLNEAFSVVRRVPSIRASLPAGGLIPWSVVSLQ